MAIKQLPVHLSSNVDDFLVMLLFGTTTTTTSSMFNTNIPIRSQSVVEDNYSSSCSSSFNQELYWKAHTESSLTVFTELSDHYGTFLLFFTSIYFDRELFTWNEELFSHRTLHTMIQKYQSITCCLCCYCCRRWQLSSSPLIDLFGSRSCVYYSLMINGRSLSAHRIRRRRTKERWEWVRWVAKQVARRRRRTSTTRNWTQNRYLTQCREHRTRSEEQFIVWVRNHRCEVRNLFVIWSLDDEYPKLQLLIFSLFTWLFIYFLHEIQFYYLYPFDVAAAGNSNRNLIANLT